MKYVILTLAIFLTSHQAFAVDELSRDAGIAGATAVGCAIGAGASTALLRRGYNPKLLVGGACALTGAVAGTEAAIIIPKDASTDEDLNSEDTQDDAKEYISGP
ncbi:MAG: hypothetical protein ACXWQO_02200 [Bdellovibrionota bacterium]